MDPCEGSAGGGAWAARWTKWSAGGGHFRGGAAADAERAGGESGMNMVSWQAAFGQGVEGDAPDPAVVVDLAGKTRSRGEARWRRRRTIGREGRGEGKGALWRCFAQRSSEVSKFAKWSFRGSFLAILKRVR